MVKPIVEHVKRAIADGAYARRAKLAGLSELIRFQVESMEDTFRAEDAIRATLEYARDNISNRQIADGWAQLRRAHLPRLGAGPGLQEAYRGMIAALLTELDGPESEGRG